MNRKAGSAISGCRRKQRVRWRELRGDTTSHAETHFGERCRNGRIRVRFGVRGWRTMAPARSLSTSDNVVRKAVTGRDHAVIWRRG